MELGVGRVNGCGGSRGTLPSVQRPGGQAVAQRTLSAAVPQRGCDSFGSRRVMRQACGDRTPGRPRGRRVASSNLVLPMRVTRCTTMLMSGSPCSCKSEWGGWGGGLDWWKVFRPAWRRVGGRFANGSGCKVVEQPLLLQAQSRKARPTLAHTALGAAAASPPAACAR